MVFEICHAYSAYSYDAYLIAVRHSASRGARTFFIDSNAALLHAAPLGRQQLRRVSTLVRHGSTRVQPVTRSQHEFTLFVSFNKPRVQGGVSSRKSGRHGSLLRYLV